MCTPLSTARQFHFQMCSPPSTLDAFRFRTANCALRAFANLATPHACPQRSCRAVLKGDQRARLNACLNLAPNVVVVFDVFFVCCFFFVLLLLQKMRISHSADSTPAFAYHHHHRHNRRYNHNPHHHHHQSPWPPSFCGAVRLLFSPTPFRPNQLLKVTSSDAAFLSDVVHRVQRRDGAVGITHLHYPDNGQGGTEYDYAEHVTYMLPQEVGTYTKFQYCPHDSTRQRRDPDTLQCLEACSANGKKSMELGQTGQTCTMCVSNGIVANNGQTQKDIDDCVANNKCHVHSPQCIAVKDSTLEDYDGGDTCDQFCCCGGPGYFLDEEHGGIPDTAHLVRCYPTYLKASCSDKSGDGDISYDPVTNEDCGHHAVWNDPHHHGKHGSHHDGHHGSHHGKHGSAHDDDHEEWHLDWVAHEKLEDFLGYSLTDGHHGSSSHSKHGKHHNHHHDNWHYHAKAVNAAAEWVPRASAPTAVQTLTPVQRAAACNHARCSSVMQDGFVHRSSARS